MWYTMPKLYYFSHTLSGKHGQNLLYSLNQLEFTSAIQLCFKQSVKELLKHTFTASEMWPGAWVASLYKKLKKLKENVTQGLGGRPVENAKHTAVAHMESDTCGCLNAPNTRPTSSNWDTHTQQIHIFRHKHSKHKHFFAFYAYLGYVAFGAN